MPWTPSNNTHLPPDWKKRRAIVIDRAGGNCQAPDCVYKGTEVDHIVNVASGGTHDLDNLQLLCRWHHRGKTQAEATTRRTPPVSPYRKQGSHPGLV